MNCKPGEMAVCISGHGAGAVVVVVERDYTYSNLVWWVELLSGAMVKKKSTGLLQHRGPGHRCKVLDECLRPIRDPGDDAVDETLAWKPVPEQVSA